MNRAGLTSFFSLIARACFRVVSPFKEPLHPTQRAVLLTTTGQPRRTPHVAGVFAWNLRSTDAFVIDPVIVHVVRKKRLSAQGSKLIKERKCYFWFAGLYVVSLMIRREQGTLNCSCCNCWASQWVTDPATPSMFFAPLNISSIPKPKNLRLRVGRRILSTMPCPTATRDRN